MVELYYYQKRIANDAEERLREYGIVMLAMQVRCGKTFTALAAADQFLCEKEKSKVLFVTKKKAIPSIEDDYMTLGPDFECTIINYESLHKVDGPFDLVIVDESHSMGAHPKPSKRTKKVRDFAYNVPVILLSGTPSPETYSQLFHQFWVSKNSPWKNYSNFYRWVNDGYVNKFQRMINGRPINDYSRANKHKIMRDINHLYISLTQEEAGFDAPVTEEILRVKMSPLTQMLFTEMEKEGIVGNLEKGPVASASNKADLVNKLSQLSGGTLIHDEEADGRIMDPNKAIFIQRRFEGKKIAIFYKYRAELELLQQFFPKHTLSPEEFNEKDDLVFLGQIQSAREGVSLRTADCLVMYNIDFSATSYWQARARIQSKDRKGSAPLYWIFSESGIEDYVMKAVRGKKNFTYTYYRKAADREIAAVKAG